MEAMAMEMHTYWGNHLLYKWVHFHVKLLHYIELPKVFTCSCSICLSYCGKVRFVTMPVSMLLDHLLQDAPSHVIAAKLG